MELASWNCVSLSLGVFTVVLAILAWYMSRRHGELRKQGLAGPRPWPVIGNLSCQNFLLQQHRWYSQYRDQKVIGIYTAHKPYLLIKDLDMIKDITNKHFPSFTNRWPYPNMGTAMDQSLIRLRDSPWKNVRSTMNNICTPDKLKLLSKYIEGSTKLLVENLKENLIHREIVELRQTFSNFSMDVIARAGFGNRINTAHDPANPFVSLVKKLLKQRYKSFIFVLFPFLVPILKFLKVPIVDKKPVTVFSRLIEGCGETRPSKYSDFIQLLIESQQEDKVVDERVSGEEEESVKTNDNGDVDDDDRTTLTNSELQGQALSFITASYDTVTSALSFTLFLLAVHTDILQKVQQELDHKLAGTFPNSDNVESLSYLDMCIDEGLRLFPPVRLIERQCQREENVQGVNIPEDCLIGIPVYSIHHDPQVWPDPETFNPGRFTAEHKANRHPYAFLPFGHGPRNCVGMKLALLEIKIALAAVLQIMTPVICERTVYPVKLPDLKMEAQDGLWVRFERRMNYYKKLLLWE